MRGRRRGKVPGEGLPTTRWTCCGCAVPPMPPPGRAQASSPPRRAAPDADGARIRRHARLHKTRACHAGATCAPYVLASMQGPAARKQQASPRWGGRVSGCVSLPRQLACKRSTLRRWTGLRAALQHSPPAPPGRSRGPWQGHRCSDQPAPAPRSPPAGAAWLSCPTCCLTLLLRRRAQTIHDPSPAAARQAPEPLEVIGDTPEKLRTVHTFTLPLPPPAWRPSSALRRPASA